MTDRERMLAAIRGEAPDRIPFVPRLDFWYRARERNGSFPAGLEGLSLQEIADRLGVGQYAVIPDFTERTDELDMLDFALGLHRTPTLLYEPVLHNVERRVISSGRETIVEYATPVGSIRTATVLTDEMLDAGASIPWCTEHPIQKPEDFAVVGYIYSQLEVAPRLERYLEQRLEMGDRGLVVAWLSGSACPIHAILRELMPVEQFFYALNDYPDKVHALAEQMEPFYHRLREIGAASDAEVVYLGGNYDDAITYPPFFERHILPPLRDYAKELHGRGKYLLTHTDGENRRLIPLYLETGFDIADSVCPAPMTRMTVEQLLGAFEGRITLMGGVASVMLCPDSVSDERFRRSIDELVERFGRHPRFILGVSDMVTADADWDRLRYIVDRLPAVR
jgi:uroporphyrinogen decarboxylase-like protein